MTNKEILEHAIFKALENGWEPLLIKRPNFYYEVNESATRIIFGFKLNGKKTTPLIQQSVYGVIFSHDFAKAVWGEAPIDKSDSASGNSINWNRTPAWVEHIQKMVIADEPITYLGENT